MKKCPFCAEEIQDEAIKCKQCGSMLVRHRVRDAVFTLLNVDHPLPAEERMAEALAAYPPQVRSLMLQVLSTRDDAERAKRIGELYADERTRGFAEVLIDIEEDRPTRSFVVGMLREVEKRTPPA